MFGFKSKSECSLQDVQLALTDTRCEVIDCRTPGEVKSGSLSGARVVDWLGGGFQSSAASFDKTKTYYLFCRSGNRSGMAAKWMKQQGFQNVHNAGAYSRLSGL